MSQPTRSELARLHKLLRCGALDEVAAGAPVDTPVDLAHQLSGLGRAEEVRLAVERVEERVQPRRNVPAALRHTPTSHPASAVQQAPSTGNTGRLSSTSTGCSAQVIGHFQHPGHACMPLFSCEASYILSQIEGCTQVLHARAEHLEVVDVKALIQRVVLGHREGVGVHALRHALLVAHRARGERLHGLVGVQVSAPDLARPQALFVQQSRYTSSVTTSRATSLQNRSIDVRSHAAHPPCTHPKCIFANTQPDHCVLGGLCHYDHSLVTVHVALHTDTTRGNSYHPSRERPGAGAPGTRSRLACRCRAAGTPGSPGTRRPPCIEPARPVRTTREWLTWATEQLLRSFCCLCNQAAMQTGTALLLTFNKPILIAPPQHSSSLACTAPMHAVAAHPTPS